MTRDDYLYYDLLIGMDTANIREYDKKDCEVAVTVSRRYLRCCHLLITDKSLSLQQRDVADPWYTGDFDATFDDVIQWMRGLLEYIKEVYNL